MILNCKDCFFSNPIKNIIFHRFIVGALWNRMMTFVGTLYFYTIVIIIIFIITISIKISKIKANFFIFPLIAFPCKINWRMQVQSMPSTGKYSQTPKNSIYENFLQESLDEKSWYHKYARFSIPEVLKNTEKSPNKKCRYCQTKKLIENRDTPVWLSFLLPENFRNTKRAHSRTFSRRQEFFDIFLWYVLYSPQNLNTGQVGSAKNVQQH